MLHYNFPSFSTGEVRRFGGPGRREIGHGALAERSVEAVLPPRKTFPYTIRVVSDILESNGSSSMASGLRRLPGADGRRRADQGARGGHRHGPGEGRRQVRASSPTSWATEDHYGDMDFKVAGTEKAITALQMDIKIAGVSVDIMRRGARARPARRGCTCSARCARRIEAPRAEMSPYAPRFVTIKIRPEKIGEIIGPGGKMIRGIQEQTGAKIDIEDDGRVTVVLAGQRLGAEGRRT